MTTSSKTALDWLPFPDDSAIATLEGLAKLGYADGVKLLLSISKLSWSEPELRKIGKYFSRFAAENTALGSTNFAGLTRVRVLVFSSHTMKHLKEAFVAVGLRDGVWIEPTFVEHVNPAQWLIANGGSEKFDIALFCHNFGSTVSRDVFSSVAAQNETVEMMIAGQKRFADLAKELCGAKSIFELGTANQNAPVASLDFSNKHTARRRLAEYNLLLADMASENGYFLLDVPQLVKRVGSANWWSNRYWFVGKIPFSSDNTSIYLSALSRVIAAAHGRARKVLVTDLDNTLWGGVIGDDGLSGIVVGQGNASGEAYLSIQQFLLSLKQRGIVLCISSKNNIEPVLEALNSHPEMLLRQNDFTIIKANWQDKAANIVAMSETLNLGLDSFVFLDDNPVERKQVRESLPMVDVPEMPDDRSQWASLLSAAGYFEYTSITAEDLERSRYYAEDAKRQNVKHEIADHGEFLRSLKMTLHLQKFDSIGRKRITQLIGKSNQFNLTTRRYSESEVADLESDPQTVTVHARLSDMFGDNGIVSCVIGKVQPEELVIDLWVMSCRVIGRMVENALLERLIFEARKHNLKRVSGTYIETSKNSLVKNHYRDLGFTETGRNDDKVTWKIELADYLPVKLPFFEIVENNNED